MANTDSAREDEQAHPTDRFSPLSVDQMTEEQTAAVKEFEAIRKSALFGPFVPLLHSPELLRRVRALGDYLRYESSFPPRLSEFIILIVASHWRQPYEWELHAPIALQAGVPLACVDALAAGIRPPSLSGEERALYDFCQALCKGDVIDEAVYERMLAVRGHRGVLDAIGITGYYSLLAMVLNTARTPPPLAKDSGGSDIPRLT